MTDLDITQALRIVEKIIGPEQLNAVQELVFRECWVGKTYQEIAADSGYDADYVRVVGSRLWQNLSLAIEEKTSKNNFKSVLEKQARKGKFSLTKMEFPDGQVPPNSNFYIERPPCETKIYEEISNPGALVVIKSPLKMGKTSLMIRTLARAQSQHYHTVVLNFQLAEASVLSDLEKFLRWLMANITLHLKISSEIDEYWDLDLGTKVSCTNYFQTHILGQLDRPLVLALDEVDHLFEYPQIAQEFLPMLRFWHEEANNNNIWQNLRIIAVHSTDIYVPLQINQSPFNLGLPIVLPEFNFEQVKELATRHQFQLEIRDLDRSIQTMMSMIGGHPYLVRQALYVLSTQTITLEQLLAEAPTPSGIYRTHLQSYMATLRQHPELMKAFALVVEKDSPIQIDSEAAYKLASLGLVKMIGKEAIPSCQLYRLHFRDCLAV